jgi:hypothetical protein
MLIGRLLRPLYALLLEMGEQLIVGEAARAHAAQQIFGLRSGRVKLHFMRQ